MATIAELDPGKKWTAIPTLDLNFAGYEGSGIDPNLLRLLAERQRKQGLSDNTTMPTQQAPRPAPGMQPQAAPMSPRLRAALMLQQRRRQQIQQQQAPSYGQAQPHGQAVPRRV
jgi:hypothetical protein